jgi:hypothetical protein
MLGKDTKTRILIFPCGTEIGLEIHRSLSQSTHVETFGANSVEPNHGAFVFKNYGPLLPLAYDPLFLPQMFSYVKEHGIDYVYPAHDDVLLTLARHAADLGCDIIGPPCETCELFRSKSATYARFAGLIPVPRLYEPMDERTPLPLFLKPDRGEGSRGTMLVHSTEEWAAALDTDPTLLSMEYLPGAEYTVDCFTDRHGNLRFAGARERVRASCGISTHTKPVHDVLFSETAAAINEMVPLRGAWFFQMKRNQQGRPVLLEAAPRVSGGMGLYRNLGVNLPLLSVYDRLGLDVDVQPNGYNIVMDRALISRFDINIVYDHVFIDLDDTLLREDGVAPLIAAFLFQCRNKKKKLHLLTRHTGDVEQTLTKYALCGLFDTVTAVEPGASKSAVIPHQDAIFIDDSHAERKEVREATGIPVFSPDAVECLLDWRQ